MISNNYNNKKQNTNAAPFHEKASYKTCSNFKLNGDYKYGRENLREEFRTGVLTAAFKN